MESSCLKRTSILYQNRTKTVTLLDLPLSISIAQNSLESTKAEYVLSCKSLAQPYSSTEPKSNTARANVLQRLGDTTNDQYYRDLIEEGLKEVVEKHGGDWCLQRKVPTLSPLLDRRKRSLEMNEAVTDQEVLEQNEPSLGFRYTYRVRSPLLLDTEVESNNFQDYTAISQRLVSNQFSKTTRLHVLSTDASYQIPPKSTFFLASIDDKIAPVWSEAVLKHYPTPTATAGPGQFDFILLDPPWDNRSVRRSKKYQTIRHQDPMPIITEVLGRHIAPNGYVACWISNKASCREVVMESFDAWGVKLVEEWVWLKVTSSGEPVYDIDGFWRKPYEILLLGRSTEYEGNATLVETSVDDESVKRRLIVAAPDLHSRKPCLKDLVEQITLDTQQYRALEVFARNLVQGWFSWGMEVLKFNWSGHWSVAE